MECHFTPDQVFDMPWLAMVRMTFIADDQADRAKSQQERQRLAQRQPRRMA